MKYILDVILGTSGKQYIENYGFSGNIAGHASFSASVTAHPFSSSHTSSNSGNWTLDNNVITPTVTVTLGTPTETTIPASMSVTHNGYQPIVDNYIDLFTDSACTNKVGTITGTSGTFTGLNPNQTYYAKANASNGYYRGYSGVASKTTYDYPHVTTTPNFKIGNELWLTLYNPLKRNCTCTMYGDDWSVVYSGNGWTGTSIGNFASQGIIDKLYASIPNKQTGTYHIKIQYNGVDRDKVNAGTYSIQGNEKPTFTNFDYSDGDPLAKYLTGKVGVNNPGILVSGLSDCIFNITTSQKATSNYGATLDHYNFAWPNGVGTSSNYSNSAAVSNHVYDGNTSTISATVYDKRGQYKTVSKSITLISPSHASGNLKTTRRNGIEATTYLNGSISYWAGDWNNGSSRPNNFYKVEYTVNGNNDFYDITNAVISNSSASTSGKIKTFNLNTNIIELHANGSSDGFTVGTQYKVQIYVTTGVIYDETQYKYDNRQKVAELTINSGTFGLSRYKSGDNYYYGINCLPIKYGGNTHALTVRGPFEQIVAQSDVSTSALGFGIGSGGVNRGIYDLTPTEDGGVNKWLIYYNNTRMICNTPLYVDGTISSNQDTSTYINGNKGINVMLNHEGGRGFHMIARQKSENGVFMFGAYNNSFNLYYTADNIISAGTNAITTGVKLLDENGDSTFPGNVTIRNSKLSVNGTTPSYTIRAWGYGTASSSGASLVAHNNLSSVSRVNQGTYQVNFYHAMPHANYAVAVSAEVPGMGLEIIGVYNRSTTSFRFDICSPSGVAQDPTQWSIMVSC